MKDLSHHAEVEGEVDEAIAYYERKRPGLGLEFHEFLDDAFARIAAHPKWFPHYRNTEFRKCFVKRFPYTVIFQEFDAYIWVVAVTHQKRRRGYWKKRRPKA